MRNVLVMMVDEMSWWALGHTGGIAKTPNIDALAARGVRFTQAYTPSPICVPTRAAIATGQYVHQIGCWSSAEPYTGTPRGWAHAVRDAGYDCASIGKLHFRSRQDDYGFSSSLEPIHVVNGEGWVQALLRKPVEPYDNAQSLAEGVGAGETDYLAFDRRVTAKACSWLAEAARQDRPWCAFVSWLAPHFPLVAPSEYYELYDPAVLQSPADPVPDHPILNEVAAYFSHDQHFTPATRGKARAAYYGLCSFVDAQIGAMLQALEASGQADDTLILFTADHGEMLGEKGFWTKSTLYDSAARVPLIMAGPDVPAGDWDAPVSLIDLAPTICAALGIEAAFPGTDLRQPDPTREVLSEYHDGGVSVGSIMLRWDHWKLVYHCEGHPAQLFNMAEDPQETQDLSAARPDILADGYARLFRHLDPEAVNTRAFADQSKRIAELGGADAIRAKGQFDYTPANSR
ncbi:MAG: sulfatase-like hydrolase/transferase [Rhodobacteraceae bacterium]|nr:sulfatase-like hydrolase/transferase [Paracoccaceae bacterium]